MFRNSFWSPDRPDDPVGLLVGHLTALLDNPAERDRLGRFGRDFAERRFGLELMSQRLAEVYLNALRSYRLRSWLLDLRSEARVARSRLASLIMRGRWSR